MSEVITDPTIFTSCHHEKNLLQGIQTLRRNSELFDITLVAEGESFPVHKIVMAACSDYFHVMFTGGMSESKESLVELKGVLSKSLRSLVNFAYSGKLELCMDNVGEVVSTARYFQMTDAVDLCCEFLEQNVTKENIVDILNLAEIHSLEKVLEFTEYTLHLNFENVPEESLLKLSAKQMLGFVGSNSLSVSSEYSLFGKVLSWIRGQPRVTGDVIFDLLSNIRFPLMCAEELSQVGITEVIVSSPRCQELLLEAQAYHRDALKQPSMQNGRTQVRAESQSFILGTSSTQWVINKFQDYYGYYQLKSIEQYSSFDFRLMQITVVDNFLYAAHVLHRRRMQDQVFFHRYDPRFDVWQKLCEPVMKWDLFLVLIPCNRQIYALNESEEMSVDFEVYSIEHNRWQAKASVSSGKYFAGTAFEERIYISGGEESGIRLDDVRCYTPASDSWEPVVPMIRGRKGHKMVVIGAKLYAFAGDSINSVEYYDVGVNQWTLCVRLLNFPVYGVVDGDEGLYILTQIDNDDLAEDSSMEGVCFECFRPETATTWTVLQSACILESFYHVICAGLTFPQRNGISQSISETAEENEHI